MGKWGDILHISHDLSHEFHGGKTFVKEPEKLAGSGADLAELEAKAAKAEKAEKAEKAAKAAKRNKQLAGAAVVGAAGVGAYAYVQQNRTDCTKACRERRSSSSVKCPDKDSEEECDAYCKKECDQQNSVAGAVANAVKQAAKTALSTLADALGVPLKELEHWGEIFVGIVVVMVALSILSRVWMLLRMISGR